MTITHTGFGEHVQGERIDSLLVDHHKALIRVIGTHVILKVNNLADLVISEFTFSSDKLISLLSSTIYKRGIRLAIA